MQAIEKQVVKTTNVAVLTQAYSLLFTNASKESVPKYVLQVHWILSTWVRTTLNNTHLVEAVE